MNNTVKTETVIELIRDNYFRYVEEGFDVPEVKIDHGNGFVKLETDDPDNGINNLLYVKKDEFGVEFTGRTNFRGNIHNYNSVTTDDEIAEIVDSFFQFFVGFYHMKFSDLTGEYYDELKNETGELFGKFKGKVFEL